MGKNSHTACVHATFKVRPQANLTQYKSQGQGEDSSKRFRLRKERCLMMTTIIIFPVLCNLVTRYTISSSEEKERYQGGLFQSLYLSDRKNNLKERLQISSFKQICTTV